MIRSISLPACRVFACALAPWLALTLTGCGDTTSDSGVAEPLDGALLEAGKDAALLADAAPDTPLVPDDAVAGDPGAAGADALSDVPRDFSNEDAEVDEASEPADILIQGPDAFDVTEPLPDIKETDIHLAPDVPFLSDALPDSGGDAPVDVWTSDVKDAQDVGTAPTDVPSPAPDVADADSAQPDVEDIWMTPSDIWTPAPDANDIWFTPNDAGLPPLDVNVVDAEVDSGGTDAQIVLSDVPIEGTDAGDAGVPPADVAQAEDVAATDVAVPVDEVADAMPAEDAPPPPADIAQAPDTTPDIDDAADSSTEPPLPDFYDPTYVPHIELTVDAAAMAVLTDPSLGSQKTWVHASFKCEGVTIADVGLRRKGASTYRVIPKKAALKVKFNKWVKGVKFRGYTDLTLNNMVDDATGLRERLSYHVYRSLGVAAPKCNTATVTLNGEDYGPYANIETPDAQWLKSWFGAKAKTLYEINEGSEWMPGSEVGFIPDVGPLTKADALALFNAVQAAQDSDLIAGVQNNLDVDEWLRYSAIEAVTAQCDNYAFGIYGSHNYFMAGDINGVFSLAPWSADLSFSDSNELVDAANPLPADPVYTAPTLLMRCKNSTQCWDAYKSHVASALAGYQNLNLVSVAKTWHDQIDALQTNDVKRESSLSYYQESVTMIYQWMDARPAVVKNQLGLP
jgi:hypothetical protein